MKRSATAVLFFYGSAIALAQLSEFKILPGDGDSLQFFGGQVSISGDHAIIGAPGFPLQDIGSAYIFKRNGSNWIQQQKLIASDGTETDYFGSSVSISGDYAIVGAPTDDDNGDFSGSAYIFKRSGSTWIEQQKLLASDGTEDDVFGGFLSISDNYAIISANGSDGLINESGAAYIFKRTDSLWVEEQKIFASDSTRWVGFGISAISGNYAIVGAPGDDDNGEDAGAVYIFRKDSIWVEEIKLKPIDAQTYDGFGRSVSISGDYVLVGASLGDGIVPNSGSAYIYKKENNNWIKIQKIFASDGEQGDAFGSWSVSISEDYALVGALGDDDNGSQSGSAYIFRKLGTTWIEEYKLTASDGTEGDAFGGAVSISGEYAIVGAYGDDDNGNSSGSAYVYNGFVLGVEGEQIEMPLSFTLQQNYPNPFNPSTTIKFTIAEFGFTILKVYDILGNEVATLINEGKPAGTYEVEWNASGLPSGVYFYHLRVNDPSTGSGRSFIETKKMVLMK
jgi:hypothetical protein